MTDQKGDDWTKWADDFRCMSAAAFVVISEYKKEKQSLITRAVAGVPTIIYTIAGMMKKELVGYEWVLADGVYENMIDRELIQLDSIHEASSYNIPHFVGFSIEKSIGLGGIYSIGFVSEREPENLLGNVVLITPRGKRLDDYEPLIAHGKNVSRQLM